MNLKMISILIFVIAGSFASAQTDPLSKIGTWSGFRKSAISFTFDDGSPNQYEKVVPLFNEYELNFTWYIVTSPDWNWTADWKALQAAAAKGHEIASHTVTHTNFGKLAESDQITELEASQKEIEAQITDQKCITFAYPYCATGNKALCEKYYIGARTCSNQIVSSTPSDFMDISSIVCGPEGGIESSKDFIKKAKQAVNSKGWCVYLLHGVDNDGGWSSVASQELRNTLAHFSQNKQDFWVATFANVIRYIKERDEAAVRELAVSDTAVSLSLTCALDSNVYNYPLSIRRQLPAEWDSAKVIHNNKVLPAQIVSLKNSTMIQFDAVPNLGNINIYRAKQTDIESSSK